MNSINSQWWSWSAERPAEISHLPSGFKITPVLYSARANHVTALPPSDMIRFGSRSIDNNQISFETEHEDTRIRWYYDIIDPAAISLKWQCVAHGEWSLRYWVNLCISGAEGTHFDYNCDTGILSGASSADTLTGRAAKKPLLVTFHTDVNALLEEYVKQGYFYLASRGTRGSFAVLRFNLEEAPSMTTVFSLNSGSVLATAPLTDLTDLTANAPATNNVALAALEAIHDVLAWNHVYDPINRRPYTVLTRFWNQQKFGGFGVWLNDILYNALLWSLFDAGKARENIEAVFVWQTQDGNFPCLITGNDAWLDRSQPPIVAYIVWSIFHKTLDRKFLSWAFPRILKNYDWWWRRRTLHDTGLVAYGTSLDVGDGLYKGTKLAAKNESSMDNMAVHDPAEFDPKTGLIQAADVGLNSLLALDGELLALMARELGRNAAAERLEQQTTRHKMRIAQWLWDSDRGVFANRLADGRFIEPIAPTSFFPMAAGIASLKQVDSLIENYLIPEHKFGGRLVLPSATRDDPAYQDNVYWRGRIWGPLNLWTYEGLRRYGRHTEASNLAKKSLALFNIGWKNRQCGENYNAETGAIGDQPDTDTFYSWGALLPALTVKDIIDTSPWSGTTIVPSQSGQKFGPIFSTLGCITITCKDGHWVIACDETDMMLGTLSGRLSNLQLNIHEFIANIEPTDIAEMIAFPGRIVRVATLHQANLQIDADTVYLPLRTTAQRLHIYFAHAN